MELAPKVALFAIGACLALYATSFIPESAKHRDSRLRDEATSNAYRACTSQIAAKLKAPSTAEFTPFYAIRPTYDGGNIRMTGYVDAQNSYGAKLRQNWTCVASMGTEGNAASATLLP